MPSCQLPVTEEFATEPLSAPLVFGWLLAQGYTAAYFAIIQCVLVACLFAARANGLKSPTPDKET